MGPRRVPGAHAYWNGADIHYLEEPCTDYVQAAIQTVRDINVHVRVMSTLTPPPASRDLERVGWWAGWGGRSRPGMCWSS
jgi:hypothetical protein